MIDLHAHLLPGLDDGPQTLNESLALLRAMEEQGVQAVVAAVHAFDGRYNASRDALLSTLEELRAAASRAGLGIRIMPSMELYLGFDLIGAVRRGQVVGLNDTTHLVVELPAREYPAYTDRALFELMMAGYRPLLVHPERNRAIQKDPDLLYGLVDRGVLPIITGASLLGRFGEDAQALAEEFLSEGAVTMVMTDAHDLNGRKPLLPDALAAARRFGKVDQAAEWALIGS